MSDLESYDENEQIKTIELNEFLSNDETASILYKNCFDEFQKKMLQKIEHFYCDALNDCQNECFNVLEKDKYNSQLNNASYELFLIVYKHISKNYDFTIFYDNPQLANCLFKEKEKNVIENKEPKNISKDVSKIFDWNQKSYK